MLALKQPWWEVASQNEPPQPIAWWHMPMACNQESETKPEVVVQVDFGDLWDRFLDWFDKFFE